jgi:hypothetical protein
MSNETMTIWMKAVKRLRDWGDRITGGGLRAWTRKTLGRVVTRALQQRQLMAAARTILKPFPKLEASIIKVVTRVAAAGGAAILPAHSHNVDESEILAALPASARKIYRTLRALISEREAAERPK